MNIKDNYNRMYFKSYGTICILRVITKEFCKKGMENDQLI